MSRGVPLDPELVKRIRELADSGTSRDGIARKLGVSRWSVDKYAPPGSFDRAATAEAVRTQQIDAAARRAVQRQRYLDIVDELQDRATTAYDHAQPAGAEGVVQRWATKRPPARETSELVKAATAASLAELRLAEHASAQSPEVARSMLAKLADALEAAAPALRGETE
jgi:hypothetical protein